MGTLGCAPAYDRFFKKAVTGTERKKKVQRIASSMFSDDSMKGLYDFYDAHNKDLEAIRKEMKINHKIKYPQMKLIDMGFWQLGFEAEAKRKRKKPK